MTLAEFLLARIAEDEQHAFDYVQRRALKPAPSGGSEARRS